MKYSFLDLLELIGSLGVFLFGMQVMSNALVKLAGNKMRVFLASLTANRFLGLITGFTTTAIIQSSSATTLMVVSFANAGLLTLTESISIIMGANIGTTITAWLIAILGFKISMNAIAVPLVGFGFIITFFKKEKWKSLGKFVIGFALLFIGLEFLKDAMPDIKSNPEIFAFLSKYTSMGYLSLLLFLLIGTVLTVVIQSSSATMALTLIMCSQGWISFDMAAAMVLGENIGTTITANLAAIVSNYHAKRTARAHLIFNILGVIWMLILFYPFLKFISLLTQYIGYESPYIQLATVPIAISLFHTFFNITNSFLLIWFVKIIANLVIRMIKEKEIIQTIMREPIFISESTLRYPETAIESIEKETKHLFKRDIFLLITQTMSLNPEDITTGVKSKVIVQNTRVKPQVSVRREYEKNIKYIYGLILQYATRAQSDLDLNENQNKLISELKFANREMIKSLKYLNELGLNVSKYMLSKNQFMSDTYDDIRRKIAKLLKIIYKFRKTKNTDLYSKKLQLLRQKVRREKLSSNKKIDKIIRDHSISPEMASSLFNDIEITNNLIETLIQVSELIYGKIGD